jgi:hypothetical protein
VVVLKVSSVIFSNGQMSQCLHQLARRKVVLERAKAVQVILVSSAECLGIGRVAAPMPTSRLAKGKILAVEFQQMTLTHDFGLFNHSRY